MEPDERIPTLAQFENPELARRVASLLSAGVPWPREAAWECPRCGLAAQKRHPAPRCHKCGFWDTVS